ncbi:hypothetical protein F5Y08DRAFT_336869 [Xylaria arbuscula]|nr:hypothetical protein F5Y08DRAFT_336869 [Xylaria arbuscula]
MAILKDTRGIEVTVMVSGKKTIEYEADNDRKKSLTKYSCPTSTKYIESKDNAKFTIIMNARREYAWGYKKHSLIFRVDIDGDQVASMVVSSPEKLTVDSRSAYNPKSRRWESRRLKFSPVQILDDSNDERLAGDLRVVKNLGLITVTKTFNLSAKSMKGKAISHGTAFSSAKKIRTPRSVTTRPLPKDKGRPIAVFNFLYRSKDALQQSLVIPRELPPVADEPKSDVKRSPIDEKKCTRKVDEPASRARAFDDLSPAERERLARERFDQMQTGVKQEGVKLEHDSKPGKRKFEEAEGSKERASNPRRVKRPAQFVDLTLD